MKKFLNSSTCNPWCSCNLLFIFYLQKGEIPQCSDVLHKKPPSVVSGLAYHLNSHQPHAPLEVQQSETENINLKIHSLHQRGFRLDIRRISQKVLSSPSTGAGVEFPPASSLKGFKSHIGVTLQDMGYWWPWQTWGTGLDGLGGLFQSYQLYDFIKLAD